MSCFCDVSVAPSCSFHPSRRHTQPCVELLMFNTGELEAFTFFFFFFFWSQFKFWIYTQWSGRAAKKLFMLIHNTCICCFHKQAQCSQSHHINTVACDMLESFPGRLRHRRIIATKFKLSRSEHPGSVCAHRTATNYRQHDTSTLKSTPECEKDSQNKPIQDPDSSGALLSQWSFIQTGG